MEASQPAASDSAAARCAGEAPPVLLGMDDMIATGCGVAEVTRDGVVVIDGEARGRAAKSWDDFAYGADAEELAAADPDHDWRILIDGPFTSAIYQRKATNEWVRIGAGEGHIMRADISDAERAAALPEPLAHLAYSCTSCGAQRGESCRTIDGQRCKGSAAAF